MERVAKVLVIEVAGVTVYFLSQNFKVARFRVRSRVKDLTVSEGDGGILPTRGRQWLGRWGWGHWVSSGGARRCEWGSRNGYQGPNSGGWRSDTEGNWPTVDGLFPFDPGA